MLSRKKFFIVWHFIFAALFLALGIQFYIIGNLACAGCEFLLATFNMINGYLGFKEYKRLKTQLDYNKQNTGAENEQD